ncbi:GTPase IMAP family member 7-like [Amia ocellicauda]|uniref:GTPase IMAP family member 7-like n=1 Tax=Amia ocellicauda TaxID=2972642 RepID=UPI003463BEB7
MEFTDAISQYVSYGPSDPPLLEKESIEEMELKKDCPEDEGLVRCTSRDVGINFSLQDGKGGGELRVVLIGASGAGKSSSGNTVLGRVAFAAGRTTTCQKYGQEVAGRRLSLLDTPDFSTLSPEQAQHERERLPGPHAILAVVALDGVGGHGGAEASMCHLMKTLEELFGTEVYRYSIVLFTHSEQERGSSARLREEHCTGAAAGDVWHTLTGTGAGGRSRLLQSCGNRACILNNGDPGARGQVVDLLDRVVAMVRGNTGAHLTSTEYQCTEERIREREQALRDALQQERQRRLAEVEEWRRREAQQLEETLMKQLKDGKAWLKERAEREEVELRRFYTAKLSAVREEAEGLVQETLAVP